MVGSWRLQYCFLPSRSLVQGWPGRSRLSSEDDPGGTVVPEQDLVPHADIHDVGSEEVPSVQQPPEGYGDRPPSLSRWAVPLGRLSD